MAGDRNFATKYRNAAGRCLWLVAIPAGRLTLADAKHHAVLVVRYAG
jgi:hypothetical protein